MRSGLACAGRRLNDHCQVADSSLQEIANGLPDSLREPETAARLGGDEFTVLLQNLTGLCDDAVAVAEKLLRSLAMPVQFDAARHGF
ncbi:diguanylate cyclase domain-containing protein [Rhodoferax ferrireducens]|uniref:diguanylate cyclase domain-containing protein n=1 Tax=Rhodoferax ferrireducens TaxID=192843 RepID=UPI00384D1707